MDFGAFLKAHEHLGFAVLIPVIAHDILFIVLEVAHIWSAVDPPEHSAVKFQHLKEGVFLGVCTAHLRSLLWVKLLSLLLVVILQEDFHHSVAIDICTAGVIWHVCTLEGRVVLRADLKVILRPRLDGLALCLLFSTHHCSDSVGVIHTSALVGEIGDIEIFRNTGAVAVKVVLHVIVLVRLYSPTEEYACIDFDADKPSVELVDPALR